MLQMKYVFKNIPEIITTIQNNHVDLNITCTMLWIKINRFLLFWRFWHHNQTLQVSWGFVKSRRLFSVTPNAAQKLHQIIDSQKNRNENVSNLVVSIVPTICKYSDDRVRGCTETLLSYTNYVIQFVPNRFRKFLLRWSSYIQYLRDTTALPMLPHIMASTPDNVRLL